MLLTRWMGGDVRMYRDSSIAPLLDLRRRLKVVADVLSDMIWGGFTLASSLGLSAPWDCILRVGPVPPISADDLLRVLGGGLPAAGSMMLLGSSTAGFQILFIRLWSCAGIEGGSLGATLKVVA